MATIGDIKLPLQGTVKVQANDAKVLDMLFDMKVPDMNTMLAKVTEADSPVLVVLKVNTLQFIALFMYRPPDIWLDFDHQKYQLYLSPNLPLLIHYWTEKRMRTQDLFESQVCTKIITYLEHYIQNQKVSHTW